MKEESIYDGFVSFLRQSIKRLKPESPVPGTVYGWGNRHEVKTLEIGLTGMKEDPEIFSALQQGRLGELQERLGIGTQRVQTLYRYWTKYSAKA